MSHMKVIQLTCVEAVAAPTLVQGGHVAAEAPQPVQSTQLTEDWSETSRCVRGSSHIVKPLQAVVLNVGDGQRTAVINLQEQHKVNPRRSMFLSECLH